ncbi:MAG: ABC transporter permease subunit [bacterium]
MPIYDQSYKRWSGQLYPRGTRWLVVAQDSIRRSLKGKGTRIIIGIGLIPFLIWVARLYISVNFEAITEQYPFLRYGGPIHDAFAEINSTFYYEFCRIELGLIFFVIFLSGCSLIADDRRTNALSLYLSKPLTRTDYLVGKGAGVAVPVACLTLFPGILLYVLHAMFRNDLTLLYRDARILLAIVLYSLLVMISGSIVILAISSMTKQGRYAAFGFIALIIGGTILTNILQEALRRTALDSTLGSPKTKMIALFEDWHRMAIALFDTKPRGRYPFEGFDWPWALLGIVMFVAVSIWILHRRVRGMDIVK